MKAIFEPTETFVKVIGIAIAIVSVLVIFITFNDYNATVYVNKLKREAINVGEAALGSACLTELSGDFPIKALFSQDKIEKEIKENPSLGSNYKGVCCETVECFKYPRKIALKIETQSKTWDVGWSGIESTSFSNDFPAAVKLNTSDVVPATVTVYVEKA